MVAFFKALIAAFRTHQRTLHEGAARLDEMDSGTGLGDLFARLFGRGEKK